MPLSQTTRRGFLTTLTAALSSSVLGSDVPPTPLGVPLRQEPLAFAFEELEPFLNARTLRRHYEEHHANYLRELRETLAAADMTVGNVTSLMPGMSHMAHPPRADSKLPLGRLLSSGLSFQEPQKLSKESLKAIRMAGGGHINHTVFWRFLCPPESGPSGPQGRAARAIVEDFGSVKTFRRVFKEAALAHPGSGWAWLTYRPDGCLVVSTTPNEDNPLMKDHIPWHLAGRPILALDLWEHSYCEQYGEDREQYIDAWWKVVNWEFVGHAYEIVTAKV
ncbi:superoxide dismutase, Fe-Mn family [Prosthecobacter debontii]|uniref:superoxide dismutase n=1 Tax=Prosthecobacter debontii TaxID=48467 RepID=A0A1T4Y8E5_9BACT|nr:superoxide dismutase [Prosthecobacter debontii]SKA97778.1 superoxide dismutase, Fe-Mn family [Prosthecobacter debontii]